MDAREGPFPTATALLKQFKDRRNRNMMRSYRKMSKQVQNSSNRHQNAVPKQPTSLGRLLGKAWLSALEQQESFRGNDHDWIELDLMLNDTEAAVQIHHVCPKV